MNDRIKSILLISLMLMSTLTAGVGTVAAQQDDYKNSGPAYEDAGPDEYVTQKAQCTGGDQGFISEAITYATTDCWIIKDLPDTQSSASYSADGLETDIENDLTDIENDYSKVKKEVYAKAQTTYAKSVADGDSKANALGDAEKAVGKYLINETYNEHVTLGNKIVNRIAGLNATDGVHVKHNSNYINGTSTSNITYYPGSSYSEVQKVDAVGISSGGVNYEHPFHHNYVSNMDVSGNWMSDPFDITINYDDDDKQSDTIAVNTSRFRDSMSNYLELRDETMNEIQTFSENLNESQYENLDPSDIVDPSTLATEWGQSYNDTNSSGYAAALASYAGYSVSDNLSTTYAVNLTSTDSVDYTGVLFGASSAWDATDGEIRTNHTYDGANQTAFVLPLGDKEKVALNKDYRVESIELKDGTSVNRTQMADRQTDEYLNASAFNANLEAYQELLNETEELEDDGGIGGGGLGDLLGGDGPLGVSWVAWIIGVVLVGIVATRD